MSRFLCSAMVVIAGMAVIAAPANAASDGDSVVGIGAIEVPFPFPPPDTVVLDVFIDAHSDASGGNPSGTFTVMFTPTGSTTFAGPVTCLEVTGNSAIIGFDDAGFGHVTVQVVDNSATGSPDTISGPDTSDPSGFGCFPPFGGEGQVFPLVSGDFVVHDALPLTSKDQCKDGGWRDFADDEGNAFDNQGECVAFVEGHAT
jgi:hypothetical protein